MHDFFMDHEHPIGPDTIMEDIEGVEKFTLRSVGIDIGSSTSHLVFSRITLRREGASLSGKYKVAKREVLFRSGIMLTPYLSESLIDIERVKRFIEEAYEEARFTPGEIDTGAVIITGEALKKENAQPIVEYFAHHSGKFICASAGQNHEALLAAYGSGAVDLSKAEQKTVLNIDMGGGTTKFSLVEKGTVTQTASVNVGARLIAFDDGNRVSRIEDAGRILMNEIGYAVDLGMVLEKGQKEELADLMAGVLFEIISQGPSSPLAKRLMLEPSFPDYSGWDRIDCLQFSGGVSEHVYDRDQTSYGDIGPILGKKMRDRLARLPRGKSLRVPSEGIRATVIGAGEYTIQASGNTSYISDPSVLPAFGLKVARASLTRDRSVLETLRQALAKFDLTAPTSGVALALSLEGPLDYESVRGVAEGVAALCRSSETEKGPLYLAQDLDVAKSLGAILKEELGLDREIIAIDGIEVGDLDYIDIGSPIGNTEVIPVTVKSLMFPRTH